MKRNHLLGNILFFAGLILLWQLFYTAACDWFAWVKPYAVPNPSGVLSCFFFLLSDGTLAAAEAYFGSWRDFYSLFFLAFCLEFVSCTLRI